MKINKHHTYNRAACICIAACLLFLSALTACSSEAEPEVMNEEWIPLEINIGSIKKLEVSPMSKAETTELPDIVRTEFKENDELKLQYDGKTTYVVLQADGSWKTRNGASLMLRPNTTYSIRAEYGAGIDRYGFCTTDCLQANATPIYQAATKKYTCSFDFTRPDDFGCLVLDFRILFPGDPIENEYVTFISAAFYDERGALVSARFPIINNRIEVLSKYELYIFGLSLERSHGLSPIELRYFDSDNRDDYIPLIPRWLITLHMIYTRPVWEIGEY